MTQFGPGGPEKEHCSAGTFAIRHGLRHLDGIETSGRLDNARFVQALVGTFSGSRGIFVVLESMRLPRCRYVSNIFEE